MDNWPGVIGYTDTQSPERNGEPGGKQVEIIKNKRGEKHPKGYS
jgi:hypothetical protein